MTQKKFNEKYSIEPSSIKSSDLNNTRFTVIEKSTGNAVVKFNFSFDSPSGLEENNIEGKADLLKSLLSMLKYIVKD